MNSDCTSNILKEKIKQIKSIDYLENIKSNYFLQRIFNTLKRNKLLEIIKHNKKLKNRLNITIKDYKEYYEYCTPIEIEIIPVENKFGKFININYKKEYYHIYFNNNKEERQRNFLTNEDKCNKIKIIIDYQIKSFEKLFNDCKCIKAIIFKKFHRINIINMKLMFSDCLSLKNLSLDILLLIM